MPRGEDRPLDDQAIGPRLRDQAGAPAGVGRDGRNADRDPGPLDGCDPLSNQLLANRGLVQLLQQGVDVLPGRLRDLLQDAGRVGVAGLQPIEVEHRHAPQTAHLDREAHIDDAVHRRREDRDGQPERAQLNAAVDFLGIDRHPAGDQRHLIEAVGTAGPLEAAQLECLAGFERRGFQGRTHTHRRRLRTRIELKGCACTSERAGFRGL